MSKLLVTLLVAGVAAVVTWLLSPIVGKPFTGQFTMSIIAAIAANAIVRILHPRRFSKLRFALGLAVLIAFSAIASFWAAMGSFVLYEDRYFADPRMWALIGLGFALCCRLLDASWHLWIAVAMIVSATFAGYLLLSQMYEIVVPGWIFVETILASLWFHRSWATGAEARSKKQADSLG